MSGKQPSQLPSKVPGEAERAGFASEVVDAGDDNVAAPDLASVAQEAGMSPEDLDALAESQGMPQQEAEIGAQEPTPDEEAMLKQLAQGEAFLETSAEAESAEDSEIAGPDEPRPIGFGQEMAARAIQGLGRNINEQQSLAQKWFGDKFEFKVRDNELSFRKKGSKRYFPLDRAGFEGGLRELMGDVADGSGEILETAAGMVGAGASVAGGAAAGGALGAAGGPIGSAGGAIAGGAAGVFAAPAVSAATSVAARQAAIMAFEGETSTNLGHEFALTTGLNVATLGMGAILKGTAKRGISVIKEVLEQAPMERVKGLAQIRQGVEQIWESVGKRSKGQAELGGDVADSIVDLNARLDKKVSTLKADSVVRGQKETFQTERYASHLSKVLSDMGVSKEAQLVAASNPKAKNELLQSLREAKVLGGDTGAEFAENLLDELATLNKKGGMTVREVWDKIDYWKKPSGYKLGQKVEYPTHAMALSRQLGTELRADRNELLKTLYKDSPEQLSSVTSALTDYTQNIDGVKQFRDMFKRARSNEKFVDAIVRPGNSKQIVQLRTLLGEDSAEYAGVRAEFMDRVMTKSIDPSTGIFKGPSFEKELQRYGADVVGEMIPQKELMALKILGKRSEKIAFMDILNDSQKETFARDTAALTLFNYKQPTLAVRMLWHLFRNNADAAKYLADDGLLEIAVNTKDPLQKQRMVKVIDGFQRLLNATDIRKTSDGRQVLDKIKFDDKLRDPKVMKEFLKQKGMESIQDVRPQHGTLPAPLRLETTQAIKGQMNDAPEAPQEMSAEE